MMPEKCTVVAAYPTHQEAEAAIQQLQREKFNMELLSIVGKDYHTEESVVGYYHANGQMKAVGKLGGFWEEIWDLLSGSAFFLMPGLGPIVVAGPLVPLIISAIKDPPTDAGLSALGTGLGHMNIPESGVLQYEAALNADAFLLIAHGSNKEVHQAETILERTTCTHVSSFAEGEQVLEPVSGESMDADWT